MNAWKDEDLLGKLVTVRNPNVAVHWTGRLVGYRGHPSVTLELEDGARMSLPADWVERPEGTE